jgi:hypothetical protein
MFTFTFEFCRGYLKKNVPDMDMNMGTGTDTVVNTDPDEDTGTDTLRGQI